MHRRIGKLSVSIRRGVTLVELCVVLALISIITVMVTSFTVLTSTYTHKAMHDNEIRSSLNLIEHAFDTWVSAFDDTDSEFEISSNYLLVNGNYWLKYENNRFTGDNGGYDMVIDFDISNVDSVTFSYYGRMIKCTVEYTLANGNTEDMIFYHALRAAAQVNGGA